MPDYLAEYNKIYRNVTAYVIEKKRFNHLQLDRYMDEANRLLNYIVDSPKKRTHEHKKALIIHNCKKNAVYHAYDVPQKNSKHDSLDDSLDVRPATGYDMPVSNPEQALILKEEIKQKVRICEEQKRLLSIFLLRLSAEERKIYRLRLYKEVSYEKIAEKIKISWSTVRRRYINIIAKLKDYYLEVDEQTRAEKAAEAVS